MFMYHHFYETFPRVSNPAASTKERILNTISHAIYVWCTKSKATVRKIYIHANGIIFWHTLNESFRFQLSCWRDKSFVWTTVEACCDTFCVKTRDKVLWTIGQVSEAGHRKKTTPQVFKMRKNLIKSFSCPLFIPSQAFKIHHSCALMKRKRFPSARQVAHNS